MNTPVTRRALLGATAALGAAALPAVAEAAAPRRIAADPDAGLLDLIARHAEVDEAWDLAEDAEDRALKAALNAYPDRPDPLWWRGPDLMHHASLSATGKVPMPNNKVRLFFTADDVERMRAAGPATRWAAVADDHPGPCPREVDLRCEVRRREVIAAHDDWEAERRAIDASSGWDAASEALFDLGDALEAVEREILATAPKTAAGLAAKARWASHPGRHEVTLGLWARQIVADVLAMAAFSGTAT